MRKLWLIPIVFLLSVAALWAYGSLRAPTVSEVILNRFPASVETSQSAPTLASPKIIVPDFNPFTPQPQPKRSGASSKTTVNGKPHRPAAPPPVPYVAEEPAVAGPECIWPFRLIPGCRPQEAN